MSSGLKSGLTHIASGDHGSLAIVAIDRVDADGSCERAEFVECRSFAILSGQHHASQIVGTATKLAVGLNSQRHVLVVHIQLDRFVAVNRHQYGSGDFGFVDPV